MSAAEPSPGAAKAGVDLRDVDWATSDYWDDEGGASSDDDLAASEADARIHFVALVGEDQEHNNIIAIGHAAAIMSPSDILFLYCPILVDEFAFLAIKEDPLSH